MRKSNNQIIFSASDLSNHIHCKHLTNLNYDVIQDLKEKPITNNKVLEVLRERGIDFENSFLIELEAKGFSIVKIQQDESDTKQKTIEAMHQGVDYIYQARLSNDKWQGWADFLIKVACPSNLGNWSYEAIDTKLSTQTRAGTILQISLYSEIIEEIQGILPEYMHVRTPESEMSYRVNDYISYLRLIKKRLDIAITATISTYPEPCSHCDICNWWEHCNSIRRKDDHLSFIAGMGTSQIKEVKLHGITTLKAMSEMPLPIPFKPNKGSDETFTKLREGILVLKIGESFRAQEWKDGSIKLENQIAKIVAKLEIDADKEIIRKEESRIYWLRYEEEKERKNQIKKRKDEEIQKFNKLVELSKQYNQSLLIREYIKAEHQYTISQNNLTDEKVEWIKWATDKADWLDPLINKRDEILDAE